MAKDLLLTEVEPCMFGFSNVFGYCTCSVFSTCSGLKLFGLFGGFCGKIVEKFARKFAKNMWEYFPLFGGKLSFAHFAGQFCTQSDGRWKDFQMVLHRRITDVWRRFYTFST